MNVASMAVLNLMGDQRLNIGATVNVEGTLNSIGYNQTFAVLNGTGGGSVNINQLQINNGGSFSGSITDASLTLGGGTFNATNTTLISPTITLNSGSVFNFGGASTTTTHTTLLNSNSTMTVFSGAQFNNSGNVTTLANSQLTVQVAGKLAVTGQLIWAGRLH